MWIYLECLDQSTSFQESQESQPPLETIAKPSPTASLTPTVKQSCSLEWQVMTSTTLPSGITLQPCREGNLKELLTLSSAASRNDHVRTLALQERERDWKASEADYFSRSCAWPKKSSPSSYSLKMFQLLQAEGDFESLEKLPKWGMIVDGVLYPLRPLERYIVARGGSCWLTPSTMDHLPVRTGEALDRSMRRGSKNYRKTSGRLNEQVVYPQMFPTPKARDWKDSGSEPSAQRRHSPSLPIVVNMNQSMNGKKLCPRWVSLLMGYPAMWIELNVWAMQWFLSRRKKRSKS